ncbi:hypothetical protein, partial [Escherichia coli]
MVIPAVAFSGAKHE